MKTWITWKTKFSFKHISFQGICMICQHNKYTYISLNTIEPIYIDLHERQMTQGYTCILKVWQNAHIHEIKTHDV